MAHMMAPAFIMLCGGRLRPVGSSHLRDSYDFVVDHHQVHHHMRYWEPCDAKLGKKKQHKTRAFGSDIRHDENQLDCPALKLSDLRKSVDMEIKGTLQARPMVGKIRLESTEITAQTSGSRRTPEKNLDLQAGRKASTLGGQSTSILHDLRSQTIQTPNNLGGRSLTFTSQLSRELRAGSGIREQVLRDLREQVAAPVTSRTSKPPGALGPLLQTSSIKKPLCESSEAGNKAATYPACEEKRCKPSNADAVASIAPPQLRADRAAHAATMSSAASASTAAPFHLPAERRSGGGSLAARAVRAVASAMPCLPLSAAGR